MTVSDTTQDQNDENQASPIADQSSGGNPGSLIPTEFRLAIVFGGLLWVIDRPRTGLIAGLIVAAVGLAVRYGLRNAVAKRPKLEMAYPSTTILAMIIVAPFLAANSFRVNQMVVLFYMIIALHGLNLLVGMAGQMALAHVAFMGVGAYSVAITTGRYGRTFAEGLVVGAILAGLTGLLLAMPTIRLHGHNLAIATISFAIVFPSVMRLDFLSGLTNGTEGISLFTEKTFGSPISISWLTDVRYHYFVAAILAGVATLGFVAIHKSAAGRGLRAMRESTLAAPAMGVNMVRSRIIAFTISAVYAGVAGGFLFLASNRFVAPDSFTLNFMIELLVALIVGGLGVARGAVLGGLFLVFVYREALPALSREVSDGGYGRIALLAGFMAVLLATRRMSAPGWFFPGISGQRRRWVEAGFALGVGIAVAAIIFVGWSMVDNNFQASGVGNLVTGAVLIIAVLSLPEGIAALFPTVRTDIRKGRPNSPKDSS
jgi:branched-chain amino acid transport system permease protein